MNSEKINKSIFQKQRYDLTREPGFLYNTKSLNLNGSIVVEQTKFGQNSELEIKGNFQISS